MTKLLYESNLWMISYLLIGLFINALMKYWSNVKNIRIIVYADNILLSSAYRILKKLLSIFKAFIFYGEYFLEVLCFLAEKLV